MNTKEHILTQLHWRYATKKFDSNRKIPEEEWNVLEKSLVLAPSSFGMEPWKFLVITHSAIRGKLVSAARNQLQVVTASHLVIFTARRHVDLSDVDALVARTAQIRNTPIEKLQALKATLENFINNLSQASLREWAIRQVYIALGQFITTAAFLGIDTCPMEGFVPKQVDEILDLDNTGYGSVLLCPAGYRQADDQYAQLAKVRRETADVIVRI